MVEVLAGVQQQLLTKVPAIKYVDENWGQLDQYSPNHPVKWPCCLIDAGTVVWMNLGNKQQQGTANITLDVANLKLTNTSGKAPAAQRTQAWTIHTIMQQVHQAIHNFRVEDFSSMMYRKTTVRIGRDDGVQQYRIVYECVVTGPYDTNAGLSAVPPDGFALEVERL